MADQTTPLGLTKPNVSDPSGANTWGTKLNANFDLIDQLVSALQSTPARVVGEVIDFAGPAAPAKWLLCAGQLVSRATYSALFAVVGTTYGAGDGSTTFGVPDLRGRATFGVDNMGGAVQGRVSSSGSGIVGATLGAAGGNQRMQAHAHATATTGAFVGIGSGSGSSQIGQYAGASGAQLTGIGLSSLTTDTQPAVPTGNSQNMPPAMMITKMIYAGA